MSEYPEHIDQIDDYYRGQLADHEIEPPADLWSKISLGAFETPAPEVKATAMGFTNVQKYIGLLAGAVILVTCTLYFYNKQEVPASTQESIPVIEQPVDTQQPVSSPETEGATIKTMSPAGERNTNVPATNTVNDESVIVPETSENPLPESKVEQPVITPQEQKADSTAEIKTTPKAPKEKVKFKDKLKKEYQDSTRKIFVPGK